MPDQDVTLYYVERLGAFSVELRADDASVEAQKMYIGDGTVAILLVAHPTNGIRLQGDKLRQGDKFESGAKIQVKPGYKKASELSPGDVYVTLPVTFVLPEE